MKTRIASFVILCVLCFGVTGCAALEYLRTTPTTQSEYFGNRNNRGKPRGEIIGQGIAKASSYLPGPWAIGLKVLSMIILGISRKP